MSFAKLQRYFISFHFISFYNLFFLVLSQARSLQEQTQLIFFNSSFHLIALMYLLKWINLAWKSSSDFLLTLSTKIERRHQTRRKTKCFDEKNESYDRESDKRTSESRNYCLHELVERFRACFQLDLWVDFQIQVITCVLIKLT
jgi:hypothetical protein